jgi:anti-sigma factor (TIGR02949 family)
VQCAESLRIQAYFDSEVDAVAAAEIERHLEHCTECRALLADLEQVRSVLRRDVAYARTPPQLRARVVRALDQETAARSPKDRPSRIWRAAAFWAGAAGGIGGTAIAATIAFLLLAPPLLNPVVNDLVSAHARSLMPAHLIDVVSTDKHTVKPWFAGHADVSPVVADFEPQGYKLIGGRADYLDHQRAAVVVYQHGAHVINVFSWAAQSARSLPRDTTRNGYHLAFWRQGDVEYCAVSDTAWDELKGLVGLLRSASARE